MSLIVSTFSFSELVSHTNVGIYNINFFFFSIIYQDAKFKIFNKNEKIIFETIFTARSGIDRFVYTSAPKHGGRKEREKKRN